MSNDIIPEQLLTIPDDDALVRDAKNVKTAIVRIHKHDHTMMKVMLKKDKMSFQKFISYCVRSYLDGDPLILKMIKTYRELESVPKDIRDNHVLSHRERQDIYKELEIAQKET